MWIRLGLIVVAIALLGLMLLGIGAGVGVVHVGMHGVSFGRETETPDNTDQPQVVSADDLLKQAGVKYTEPASTSPATVPSATPEVPHAEAVKLASATGKPADVKPAAADSSSPNPQPTEEVKTDRRNRAPDATASRDVPADRDRNSPRRTDRDGNRDRGREVAVRDRARGGPGREMVAIRISAGNNAPLTDGAGSVWEADSGFENGNVESRGEIPIANTRFPALYRHEHWNMSAWRRAVPNGEYTVRLHFCETYDLVKAAGQRVFGVELQGRALGDVDVFKEADGRNKALVKSAHITVTDGMVVIRFIPTDRNVPEINGIEVIPDSPESDAPRRLVRVEQQQPIRVQAGSAANRELKGVVWEADSGFDGGQIVDRGRINVKSHRGPEIFRTEHYGMTAWHRRVPNGKYVVYLYFAETSDSVHKAGDRVFNVSVQGNELRNLDVFKEAGGLNKGLVKMFNATVTDGKLSIIFEKTDKNVPEINGIEVFPDR